jgi:hypothetical protein
LDQPQINFNEQMPATAGVVALGVPHHFPMLPGYFLDSIVNLRMPTFTIVRVEGKPVDIARNAIIELALKVPGLTHLFFMDSDQRFHPNTLARLMAHDLPIVSGTYFMRTDTPWPHVYRYAKSGPAEDLDGEEVDWYQPLGLELSQWMGRHPEWRERPNAWCYDGNDGLVECDATGGGCLLIKREVLEAIGKPWCLSNPTSGGGEDFDLCRRAREAGYKVYADFAVQCDHEAKGAFIGHLEFAETFQVGTDAEYDWASPLMVEVMPNNRRVPVLRPRDAQIVARPGFRERLRERLVGATP